MPSPSIKICGITSPGAARAVIENQCEFAGLIFHASSPRHLSMPQAVELANLLRGRTCIVAVTVDASMDVLDDIMRHVRPDALQLHGNEALEGLQNTKARWPQVPLIKAFKVRAPEDISQAESYAESVDMLLFDAPPPAGSDVPGGHGIRFDWGLLKGRTFAKPWFLSGGLTPANVAEAIRQTGARMVDVSSGVEASPGVKDNEKIRLFTEAARHAGNAET